MFIVCSISATNIIVIFHTASTYKCYQKYFQNKEYQIKLPIMLYVLIGIILWDAFVKKVE